MAQKIIIPHDKLMQLAFVGRTQLSDGTWLVAETVQEQRARERKERKIERQRLRAG